jgi:hypothetical protein
MLRKVNQTQTEIQVKGVNMLRKVLCACVPDPIQNKNPLFDYSKGVNICRNVMRNPAKNTFFNPFSGGQYPLISPFEV